MADFSFDARNHELVQDISDPIPAGWYAVTNTGSDLRGTKAGTGQRLEIEHTVRFGEYKGRKVWSRFNVVNANEQAEEIAHRELATLCHAVVVLGFKTHEQLRDKGLLVRVVVRHDTGWEPMNVVKSWKANGDTEAPAVRDMRHARESAGKPASKSGWSATADAAAVRDDHDSSLPF